MITKELFYGTLSSIFVESKWNLPIRLIYGLSAADAAYAVVTQSRRQGTFFS